MYIPAARGGVNRLREDPRARCVDGAQGKARVSWTGSKKGSNHRSAEGTEEELGLAFFTPFISPSAEESIWIKNGNPTTWKFEL